jgi:hypothetical protein
MAGSFTPVAYDFRDVIADQLEKKATGKVFFFNENDEVDSYEGQLITVEEIPQQGIYIRLSPENKVRIDRIITLFGKPGAAFDEYDSFSNQCLACTGGYPL